MPIAFAMGFYSQLKTFLNFLLEQIEYHCFGGSGSSGIGSATISLLRSLICFLIPLPLLYYSIENSNTTFLSFYLAISVSITYHLSKQTNSNPNFDWLALSNTFASFGNQEQSSDSNKSINSASPKLLQARLETALIIGLFQFGFFFCVSGFNVFDETNKLKPLQQWGDEIGCFSFVMVCLTSVIGIVVHYLMPRMRQLYPWGLFKAPFLRNSEWRRFEATAKSGRVLWFEKLSVLIGVLERNIIYPLAILNETWLAFHSKTYFIDWPPVLKCFVIGLMMTKLLRHSFRSTHHQWLIFLCSHLLKYDLKSRAYHEPIIITWFLGNIVYIKLLGFRQRFGFILVQLNPGTTWGSAFHAIAQPFAAPHSGWLFVQTLFSTLTSAPLKPIGGSTIFLSSYVRPFRFWEKNYNTKLNENQRLQSQLEYHRKRDENSSKNALFYENLAFSLKKNLAADIQMGRYGNVREGDVFILASSSTSDSQQNGLIQIVEIGNGIVSFQFRGLEFKGTFWSI